TTSLASISGFTGFIYCTSNDNNKALSVSVSGTAFYVGDTNNTCD
ncbi:MAG: GspH/FimT family pseudopilin, partial [Pseudoalteromonas sp.]